MLKRPSVGRRINGIRELMFHNPTGTFLAVSSLFRAGSAGRFNRHWRCSMIAIRALPTPEKPAAQTAPSVRIGLHALADLWRKGNLC
jgi:hypothetical protein